MNLRSLRSGLAFTLACVTTACAHDFWIAPSDLHQPVGTSVGLTLLIGHAGSAERYARSTDHIARFWSVHPDGSEHEIEGEQGSLTAGAMPLIEPGVYIAGYESQPQSIELPAPKFTSYLKEEGLERIITLREQRNESGQPGREVYSRSCKSIVFAAGKADEAAKMTGFDRVIGLPMELVPVDNPFSLRAGETIRFTLLINGTPASGVLVSAESLGPHGGEEHGHEHTEADHVHGEILGSRTDESGRASFELPVGGVWLFTATSMAEAESAEADWQSVWTSLMLEVPTSEHTH